jgi:hypothetical protein
VRIELELNVKLKEVNLEYFYMEWTWNEKSCGISIDTWKTTRGRY